MDSSVLIQSITSIIVALISGIFGFMIARMQVEDNDESERPRVLLPGQDSYIPVRPRKSKARFIVVVFVLIGGVIGFFIGGNIRKENVLSFIMTETPTVTITYAFTPSITPSPTYTSTSTFTPTITVSPTPSPTNSYTPSPTNTHTPTFSPTPTRIGGGAGQIAYEANIEGNFEIFILDLSNSDATPENITNNFSDDYDPSWSPNGERLAFVTHRDGNPEIYIMDADGSELINITESRGRDYEPSWSPDGEKIVFSTYRFTGNREIAIMNLDDRRILQLTNNPAYDGSPAFIDNETIVFATSRDDAEPIHCSDICNYELYVIDVEGQNLARLTDRTSFESHPQVSADGERIVLHSTFYGSFDIYTLDTNGYNFNMVGSDSSKEWYPSWSPDGRWIVYVSEKSKEAATIYIIHPDGSGKSLVINLPEVYKPIWRP